MLRQQSGNKLFTATDVALCDLGHHDHANRGIGLFHGKFAQITESQTQLFGKIPDSVNTRTINECNFNRSGHGGASCAAVLSPSARPSPARWLCRNPSARQTSLSARRPPCPCPSCRKHRSP